MAVTADRTPHDGAPLPAAPTAPNRSAAGIWLALLAAATFGSSGSFGKSLLEAGWSPGAAVTARIGGAALVLAVPTLLALRGRWRALGRNAGLVVAYGAFAMAACQVAYFNAVTRLDVGVALLLEYLAPVLVIGWLWLRTGVRPSSRTLLGAGVSIVGLVLVLDVTGSVQVDLVGVAWGLAAASCLVVYFLLSAREVEGLPPLVLAGAALAVATVTLLVLGLVGVLPFHATTADVTFVGRQVPFVVPLVALVVVSTSVPYVAGIASTRLLGSRLASFVGLTEVLFAVLFAWLLLGELPVAVQLLGGVLIVAGVAVVRAAEPVTPVGPAEAADELPVEATDAALAAAEPGPSVDVPLPGIAGLGRTEHPDASDEPARRPLG